MSAFAARKALTPQASSPSMASKDHDGSASIEDLTIESKSVALGLPDTGFDAEKEGINLGITSEEPGSNGTFMDFNEDTQLSSYVRYKSLRVDTSSVADYLEV